MSFVRFIISAVKKAAKYVVSALPRIVQGVGENSIEIALTGVVFKVMFIYLDELFQEMERNNDEGYTGFGFGSRTDMDMSGWKDPCST